VSHPLQIFLSFGRKKVMDLKNIQRKAILMHSRTCSRKSLGGGSALYSRQKSGVEGGYIDDEDKSWLVEERWWGKQSLRAFVFGYILTLFEGNCEVWMPAKPNKRALFFQLGKGIKRFPDCGL
jgi:hypothetical protein